MLHWELVVFHHRRSASAAATSQQVRVDLDFNVTLPATHARTSTVEDDRAELRLSDRPCTPDTGSVALARALSTDSEPGTARQSLSPTASVSVRARLGDSDF